MVSYTKVMPIMEQLPKTLSSSETKELFLRFESGDKEACEKLRLSNLRLVAKIIKGYENIITEDGATDYDDLMSIGIIGLIKAINTFNLDKGLEFSTYAAKCINNEILMIIRKNNRQTKWTSLESIMVNNGTEDGPSLEDVIPSDENIEDNYEQKESLEIVREALKILSPLERQVIELYYGFNSDPLREVKISKLIGYTHTTVSKVKTRSLKKIGKYLEQCGQGVRVKTK